MIKIPARPDGQWSLVQSSDKLPDLIATKNLSFDKEGYLKLAKPVIALYSDAVDSDFGLPLGAARLSTGLYKILTNENQFSFDFGETGWLGIAEDTRSGAPAGYADGASVTYFNKLGVYAGGSGGNDIDSLSLTDGSWTSRSTALSSSDVHTAVNFQNRTRLAVTNSDNTVLQYNTAFTSVGPALTIPADQRVTAMCYNANYVCVGTEDATFQGNAVVAIWDGARETANYIIPVGAESVHTILPFKDTFAILTSNHQLLVWTGTGLTALANLPAYYSTATPHWRYVGAGSGSRSESNTVDGDLLLFNINPAFEMADEEDRGYNEYEPGGIWCFDEAVGLYHRHATTSLLALNEAVYASGVNTTTDQITVSAAPDTGTPVYYTSSGATALGGLTDGELYYTIKVDSTHVQLATTYANALAGTEIDITTAPSGWKETVTTANVNTTTDEVTTSTAPAYLDVVRYDAEGGTVLAGLTDGGLYFADANSTTFQLATDYFGAVDQSTVVDLTGTGNDSQTFENVLHYLTFIPKSDFGQSFNDSQQGMISKVGPTDQLDPVVVFEQYFWGAQAGNTSTTEQKAFGAVLRGTENRGYFVTSKFLSAGLQDDWQKLFIKHSELTGEFDEIVVKYRTVDMKPITKILKDGSSFTGTITWSDSDTFTTTDSQWANVVAGDEVEIVQGAGAGYCLHVSSISESGGTYTVNLDESVKNISASDTGRAIANRWNKLTTLDNGIITNEDGYSEITIGEKSKQIQFKIELRGEDVEIEEILVAHIAHKPVA